MRDPRGGTMRLYVIVVKDKNDGTPWVVNAWDEYSVDENYQGFDEEVEKTKRAHRDGEVCVGIIRVPGNVLDSLFVPGVRAGSPGRLIERFARERGVALDDTAA